MVYPLANQTCVKTEMNEFAQLWANFALTVFTQFLSGEFDAETSSLANCSDITIDTSELCFTLPALFSYLNTRNDCPPKVSYAEFRKAIYASDINLKLRLNGGAIDIKEAVGSVNLTQYRLRELPQFSDE